LTDLSAGESCNAAFRRLALSGSREGIKKQSSVLLEEI